MKLLQNAIFLNTMYLCNKGDDNMDFAEYEQYTTDPDNFTFRELKEEEEKAIKTFRNFSLFALVPLIFVLIFMGVTFSNVFNTLSDVGEAQAFKYVMLIFPVFIIIALIITAARIIPFFGTAESCDVKLIKKSVVYRGRNSRVLASVFSETSNMYAKNIRMYGARAVEGSTVSLIRFTVGSKKTFLVLDLTRSLVYRAVE